MTSTTESLTDAGPTMPLPMTERVRGLGTRNTGSVDRWMLVTGSVLVPLGLLLIILGWVGASDTPLLFEQVPYLISGGILGLGLVCVGCSVYFAYWYTVGIREARTQQHEVVEALVRIEALLGGEAVWAPSTAASSSNGHTGGLVATASGTLFHRPDCSVVAGRDKLRNVKGTERGLKPCRICNPLAAS